MKKGLWLVVMVVLLALLVVQGVVYAQGTGITGLFHNMTISHEGDIAHHADMADMVHDEGAAHEGDSAHHADMADVVHDEGAAHEGDSAHHADMAHDEGAAHEGEHTNGGCHGMSH